VTGGFSVPKQIVIDISHDGEIRIETTGYEGPSCFEDSQFIKDLLGKEISVQLCPAFYKRGKEIIKRHIPLCG
jgi:hypothetical protein